MSLTQWTWIGMALLGASLWLPAVAIAQGNFEIQVYGSETVEPGKTMFELHSNIAIKGTTTKEDGIFPTQHAGKPSKLPTGSPRGSRQVSTCSRASNLTRAGSGWGIISARGSACRRVGRCPSG